MPFCGNCKSCHENCRNHDPCLTCWSDFLETRVKTKFSKKRSAIYNPNHNDPLSIKRKKKLKLVAGVRF